MVVNLTETIRKHLGWCPRRDFPGQLRTMRPSAVQLSSQRLPGPAGAGDPDHRYLDTVAAVLPDVCLLALIAALQIIVLYPAELLNRNDAFLLIVPAGFAVFWMAIWLVASTQVNLNFTTRKLLTGCILAVALILEIIIHIV